MSEETKKTSEEQEAEKEIPVTDGDQEEENLTPEGEDLPEEENNTPGEEAASEDKKEEKSKKSNAFSKKDAAKEKPSTEKIEKTDKKETETKSKKPIYRVIYDKDARVWLIKKDGAKRTISSYPTKEEALNRVKDLSSSNDLNYIVHKKDGKFQKK